MFWIGRKRPQQGAFNPLLSFRLAGVSVFQVLLQLQLEHENFVEKILRSVFLSQRSADGMLPLFIPAAVV